MYLSRSITHLYCLMLIFSFDHYKKSSEQLSVLTWNLARVLNLFLDNPILDISKLFTV